MTKEKDIKTVVPALQFPEFRDADEWEVSAFSDYIRLYRGSSPRPIQQYLTQNDDGVNWIKIGDAKHAKNFTIDTIEEKITIKGAQKSRQVYTGELILANSMSFGKTYLLGVDGCIYDGWFVLREYENYFLKSFLLQLLNSEYLQNQYEKLSAGGIVQNISSEIVYQTTLPKTSILEQQKIADCLGNLDDLISAVADKIEALKEYKKGLMQQLFPADSKTTPTLRFPEFQNAGDWNIKPLSGLCNLVRGPFGGALKKEIFVEDGYAVYEQSHAIHGDMNAFRYYITEDKFNELIRFAVCPNDIIMSCSGTMGKFAVIPNSYKEGVINQALLKLSTKKGNDYRFIKLLLEIPCNQEQLLSESAGGAIKNVASVGQIKEMSLCIPELKEQQKIADFVSSVDDLISTETDKLDQLKAHKKGLMQQLFPTLNE